MVSEQKFMARICDSFATVSGLNDMFPGNGVLRYVFSCFCYQQFLFFIFSHTTQQNIQNKTKQNSRHILNISRFNQKGGREGRTTRTQKSLL